MSCVIAIETHTGSLSLFVLGCVPKVSLSLSLSQSLPCLPRSLVELHQCAVFCLLQCGKDIRDTNLVVVDRTLTDICFEDTVLL